MDMNKFKPHALACEKWTPRHSKRNKKKAKHKKGKTKRTQKLPKENGKQRKSENKIQETLKMQTIWNREGSTSVLSRNLVDGLPPAPSRLIADDQPSEPVAFVMSCPVMQHAHEDV